MMFGTDSEQAARDRASFFLTACVIFIAVSLPVYVSGLTPYNWTKLSIGTFGIFVGMFFFGVFTVNYVKLTGPFINKKVFIASLDYWSMPVFIASVFAILVLLGISTINGQLWENGLINPWTVTIMGLLGMGSIAFIAKALIWNNKANNHEL